MRWIDEGGRAALVRMLLVALTVATLRLPAPSAEEKRLTVYAPEHTYVVAIEQREGSDWVNLYDVLSPLGETTSRIEGHRWRVRFNRVNAEFDDRRQQARIGPFRVELAAPPRLEGDRGLVPYASISALAAHFLEKRVDFHAASHRMLIGEVGIRFTATAKKTDPPVVVLNFSAPVNPTISTEAGTLRMTFRRQPVVSYSEHFSFENNLIPGATYTEAGGTAELTMTGTAPLMASFSDGGRTITISTAPGGEVAAATAPAATPAPAAGVENPMAPATTTTPAATPASTPPSGTIAPARPKYLVVIDASHGGDERGAALTEDLAEKDVNLAMAYRLRSELQNRGITCFLVREGDSTVPLDQRAAIANESRAAVFISLHADMVGTGVRVYTSLLPASDPHPSSFLPWDAAQRPYQASSRLLADTVLGELDKQQIPAAMLPAPLRPLNNVAATAIAVELAPQKPDIHSLTAKYEQTVAAAVANAVATARPRLEAAR